MAPATNAPSKGANPAPNYKEAMNTISLLMAQHSAPSFLSQSRKPVSTSQPPPPKTAAQFAAQAEDLELDRLAVYDDNLGVGMFKPENAAARDSERKIEFEERRLRGRLGLGKERGGKGKKAGGSEWDGVSGVRRAREQASEDDDEEMGRSAVGRAKKRKRVAVDEETESGDVRHGGRADTGGVMPGGEDVTQQSIQTTQQQDPTISAGLFGGSTGVVKKMHKKKRKKNKI